MRFRGVKDTKTITIRRIVSDAPPPDYDFNAAEIASVATATSSHGIFFPCDKHIHAGREYPCGAIIRDMDADSADWLISIGRAEEFTGETVDDEGDDK